MTWLHKYVYIQNTTVFSNRTMVLLTT